MMTREQAQRKIDHLKEDGQYHYGKPYEDIIQLHDLIDVMWIEKMEDAQPTTSGYSVSNIGCRRVGERRLLGDALGLSRRKCCKCSNRRREERTD